MSEYLALAIDGNGFHWDIEGPDAGAQGVWIAPKPKQFYDTPAETFWIKSGGSLERYQGFSYRMRKPLFHLVTADDDPLVWRRIEDELRMTFGNPDDTWTLTATILPEGTQRKLTMRLFTEVTPFETLEFEGKDPHLFGAASMGIAAACEQPHWEGEDSDLVSLSVLSGTSRTATILHPGNPGDAVVWSQWAATAPATIVLPDPSWGQEGLYGYPAGVHADRTVPITPLIAGEDCTIYSDPDEEFIVCANGSNAPWMRSNGNELIYPVAPFTPPTEVEVSISGAYVGAAVSLRVPRRYTRPWGVSL